MSRVRGNAPFRFPAPVIPRTHNAVIPMSRLRFLERLRHARQQGDERNTVETTDIIQSVTNHLSRILNTRQGNTVLDQDFGMPDFSALGASFSTTELPRIERELSAFISRCEPRLKQVHIRYAPDPNQPLQLAFFLDAELALEEETVRIHWTTLVEPSGRVVINT